MNKINILNEWFLRPCLIFLFLFVSIFLNKVFTSSYDTTFTFFRRVSVTPGPVILSHLPPRTSGTSNHWHHLTRWITGHFEWEHIRFPGLYVGRNIYRPRNLWITGHLEWEHIRRPGLCLYVLLKDELDIIAASRWNQPFARKSMKLLLCVFFSAPSSPHPSEYASKEHLLRRGGGCASKNLSGK